MKWLIRLLGVVLTIFLMSLLSSCEKESNLIGQDVPTDHADTIPFIMGCGTAKYHIEVEGWQTMWEPYGDTMYVNAYLEDNNHQWHCIYYRRFTAHIFDDYTLRYIGWGYVTDTNYVDYEHLDPNYIDVTKP